MFPKNVPVILASGLLLPYLGVQEGPGPRGSRPGQGLLLGLADQRILRSQDRVLLAGLAVLYRQGTRGDPFLLPLRSQHHPRESCEEMEANDLSHALV